jgi:hypothetical protein
MSHPIIITTVNKDEVTKVGKGKIENGEPTEKGTIKRYNERGQEIETEYNINNLPPEVRREVLREFSLTKVLSILYKDSIPERRKIFSKFAYIFSQKKVEGVKYVDEIKYQMSQVDTDSDSIRRSNVPGSRFRIKSESRPEKVTDQGWQALGWWSDEREKFKKEMDEIGVKVDFANQDENFIKENGQIKYIDTFSVPDKGKTYKALLSKIENFSNLKIITETEKQSALHWLNRFNKI